MSKILLSRKPVKLLIIFTLAFIVSLPIICPFQVATAQSPNQSQYYNTEFAWDYGGLHWDWNMSIPVTLDNAYTAIPDSVRTQYGLADFGFFTTTQDNYMQTLADKLNDTATQLEYSSSDEVNFVLAFVQSIPYKLDNASTGFQDYPRFPVETLVDNVGDCKSHSILFATLMLILGYGTVFINPPDHLAVGVLGNNIPGTYWTYNDQTYYYCETTGIGFTIGELPQQFNGQTANVYPIDYSQQYVPNLQETSSNEPNPTISSNTPTPTFQPNPTTSPSPTMPGPTIQPVLPMSLNLISNDPILFTLIVLAIVISITITIKTANRSKPRPPLNQTLSPESNSSNVADANLESAKFCIYCGSNNKSFALYCEKCGKKIA
ncbi:MAG: hypothetical protein ABSD42_05200 [Candidatus Bathyarchaeia archaeon]|jgi:hypothetical protein